MMEALVCFSHIPLIAEDLPVGATHLAANMIFYAQTEHI